MKKMAEMRRKERGRINADYGQFTDKTCKHFQEGSYLAKPKAEL